jgi:hypothetical protein
MIPITEFHNHIFENLFYDEDLEELVLEGNLLSWLVDSNRALFEGKYVCINDVEGVEYKVYKEDVEKHVWLDDHGDILDEWRLDLAMDGGYSLTSEGEGIEQPEDEPDGDDILDEDDFDDENAFFGYLEDRFKTKYEPEEKIKRDQSEPNGGGFQPQPKGQR